MGDGPAIQYKFGQQGIEEITSQIKVLHSELRDGSITYQQYNQQMKEVSAQGRAATQEFNQLKGAVAASNPEVLELTRTMSTFGSVASTVLAVTNAINLAQMASMGIDQTVMQDKTALAGAMNVAVKDLAAFGPASAQYQSDMANVSALTNKLAYDQTQLAYQSISTGATLIASGVAIVGGLSQSYLGISAAIASLAADGTLLENVGIAFTAMGNAAVFAMTSVLLPIALAAAALYGLEAVAEAVFPKFGNYMSTLQSNIESSWNVSGLEAYLIAPFVGAYVDIMGIGSNIEQGLIGVYNGIITGFIDPLITAFDDTVGKITGQVATINTMSIPATPTTGSILAGIGINAGSGIAGEAAGQDTSATSASSPPTQILQQIQGAGSMQLAQAITQTGTSSQILQSQQAAGAALDAANSNLVTINTNIPAATAAINSTGASQVSAVNGAATTITAGLVNLGTTMTAASTAQTAAYTSALAALQQQQASVQAQISTLQAQAATLAAQPQTQAVPGMVKMDNGDVVAGTANNSGANGTAQYYEGTPAALALAQINQQISQLQQQSQTIQQQATTLATGAVQSGALNIGSSSTLNALTSAGVNPNSVIGNITNNLDGTTAAAQAAATAAANAVQPGSAGNGFDGSGGTYGSTPNYTITTNALTNGSTGVSTTALQNQVNQAISNLTNSGVNVGSYFGTSPAAGYGAAYGGLAGKKAIPNPDGSGFLFEPAATGMDADTTGPTRILAGEAGPEHVSIQPLQGNSTKSGGNITVSVVVQGTVTAENDLANFIGSQLKQQLRGVGFT